jgi:uncharacterized repeat protein (TIGR01451 family)
MSAVPRIVSVVCVLLAVGAGQALAQVTILTPADGATFTADPCPVAPCTAKIEVSVDVQGAAPLDRLVVLRTRDGAVVADLSLCQPGDPIEGTPDCPAPPVVVSGLGFFRDGTWTLVARAIRGSVVEDSAPVSFTVLPPNLAPAGAVRLLSVEPLAAAPAVLARDPGPNHAKGILTAPGRVEIVGENLDTNPFLDVFVAPVPFGEPTLSSASALPVDDWCLFPAEIVRSGPHPDGSLLEVELPTLPLETPTTCGLSPGPEGSTFTKNWRFVVRDRWVRPEREHQWWAIPSPRLDAAHGAPPFRMVKPAYPDIDGFGFRNHKTTPELDEFLTVYGKSAYVCADCIPFVGCACLVAAPDPLYWIVWSVVYMAVIESTGGSCNGMSATSLLFARDELETEQFEPDVHFPIGFDTPGPDAVTATDKNGNAYMKGVSTYEDTNWCTPFCSPPKPANLWAHIRMNHGVQLSREFLREILETVGEAIFDPNDLATIKGVPEATLERVRANPTAYVLCFFEWGSGHCVTPYRVDGNRIHIYDNNAPGNVTRYIDIVGGDYDYPARRDVDKRTPNRGNAIVAFPLSIWRNARHLLGVNDLSTSIGGNPISFLQMIAVGSADMGVSTPTGGRWGWEDDGSFTDSLFGAISMPPLGPQDEPGEKSRAMPLLFAMNQAAPEVRLNTRENGSYAFQAGAGGHLFQLEASAAAAGDTDRIGLGYTSDRLESFSVTPQRDAAHMVPRVGMVIGEQESAVFHWLGLEIPGGTRAGFAAARQQRATTYANDTGRPSHHVLALDHASGPANAYGRTIYGPFEVPAGAAHRVVLTFWPDVAQVTSELDFDRDGTADHIEIVPGRSVTPGTRPLSGSADLAVSKSVSPGQTTLGQPVTFTVTVTNAGPDDATNVTLADVLPPGATVADVTATRGTCASGPDGLTCALGSLPAAGTATVSYVATATSPGSLANGATVFGDERDPRPGNNTAIAAAGIEARVDIKPGDPANVVNPGAQGVVPVAILGRAGFDMRTIDPSTLRFGPGGAPASGPQLARIQDVNRDGIVDLVSHYPMAVTGITAGDSTACVRGAFRDGRQFGGCDVLRVVPGRGR